VRTLVDYRPALRSRTGVGEYTHELARALVRTAGAGDQLLLFSSSWRDRLAPDAVPGAGIVDRRWPVRALNYLWHRWEWPSAEWLAGQPLDVAHSLHPLLMPARAAAQVVTIHDLDFLDHPERTTAEIRRDYTALAAAHATRADRVIAVSHFTAGEITRRFSLPAVRSRRTRICCSWARSSRERTWAGCSTPTAGCWPAGPTRRASSWRVALRTARQTSSRGPDRRRLPAALRCPATWTRPNDGRSCPAPWPS
jgi:hypothetical protein